MATSFPSEIRAFPSIGLTWVQMINFVRSLDLDIEVIDAVDDEIITTAVKAYLNSKIPLIASLKLEKECKKGLHAAVITGYRYDAARNVKELYIHDDQIGPYSRVKPCGDFKVWNNEWMRDKGYTVRLEKLLVPIYPKIRLTFGRIYFIFTKIKEDAKYKGLDFTFELTLNTIEEYKRHLLENSIERKIQNVTMSLPKFLWVVRTYEDGRPIHDRIYDGVSVYPKRVGIVHYRVP